MQAERVLKTLKELKLNAENSPLPLKKHQVLQEDLDAAIVIVEEWLKAKEAKVEEQK